MTADDRNSLAWVVEHFPQRIGQLLAALDLGRPGLERVRAATVVGDPLAACSHLLDYYRSSRSGAWLRHAPMPPGEGVVASAEKAADAIFAVPGAELALPRLPSGGFDWGHAPPVPGGAEWAYGINRHDYMAELLAAFYATGNRRYVRSLDEQLHDWAASVTRPAAANTHEGKCPWGTILEVGHRAKAWPAVFYGLQPEAEFTPATRLLLLSQALDHATFLYEHHAGGSNWIITEMAGLLSLACAWPEFREATVWRDLALSLTGQELAAQVYPDGVQKELSSNYQLAVLLHMGFFVDTVRGAGLPEDLALAALLEQMWNYLAYSLGPHGHAPQNGDSDRPGATDSQVLQPLHAASPLAQAAAVYGREDWRYILTNGAHGERPPGLPSVLFPWAGQLIMRSGWEAEAQWGFFDVGPWGLLHQHNDALHLSVTAGGRDLLVDAGRYTYQNYWGEPGTWRSYFIGSAAHNVILVDGFGQANGRKVTDRPLEPGEAFLTAEYDYAQRSYTHGFVDVETAAIRHKSMMYGETTYAEVQGEVVHTRAVLYLRGTGWVVVDRIETEKPRHITALWHFSPQCTVAREGQSVVTVDEGVENLRVQPVGTRDWQIELVSGREGPDFQGWYSPEMDVRVPNTCACYTAEIPRTTTLAWLLVPGRGRVTAVGTRELAAPEGAVHLVLDWPGRGPLEIAVRLDRDSDLRLANGEAFVGHCAVRPAKD